MKFLLLVMVLALAGCTRVTQGANPASAGFTLVVLKNNSVMIGKLSALNTDFPQLQDVFILRPPMRDEKTGEISKPALVRRKSELHNPAKTMLTRDSILYFEPIDENSNLAQLIRDQVR